MTHSELHAFIDRNTRLLSNESVASKLGCAQRKSVQEDLEAAKRRLEGGSLAPAEGRGLVHTLGDLTLRGEGEAEAERQMESAADVKRRLVSCSSWVSCVLHRGFDTSREIQRHAHTSTV